MRERFEMKYSRERERDRVYYHLTCITTSSGFKWAQQIHKLHYIKENLTNEPKHIEQHSKRNTKKKKEIKNFSQIIKKTN